MSFKSKRLGAAGLVLMLAGFGASTAMAQTYNNPALPRSPYALPTPTYDEDNDPAVQAAPQWRHWGDWKQGGQLQEAIMGLNRVGADVPPPPVHVDDWRRRQYCRHYPGACDE